jgi:hypothetical protein
MAYAMLPRNAMDLRQTNKSHMYRSVATVATNNIALTSSVAAFGRQLTALQATIDTIDTLAQAQEASTAGITLDKTRITDILVNATLAVAGAVAAWASENNNEEVRARMNLTPSSIKGSLDRQIPATAKMVADEAAKHDLKEFGAGPLVLEAFNAKIEAYNAIMNAPREAVVATVGLTTALEQQFTLGDKILKERLDKLMEQFRESQPQFFAEYKSARSIVDRGGGQQKGTPSAAVSKSATGTAPSGQTQTAPA